MDGTDPGLGEIQDMLTGSETLSFWDDCSPCSALPPELLSMIFQLAKPKKRMSHKISFEVTVSHVSKFWRATALNTPSLWDRIDIYSTRATKWVDDYLERSSRRPLDVYINIYRSDKRRSQNLKPLNGYEFIIDSIYLHLERIRLFSMLCYHQTTAVYWQSLFRDRRAPILQTFTVECGSKSSIVPPFGSRTTVFEEGLQQLTLWNTDTPNILPPPQNLHNLSTLYLHGLDPSLSFTADDFTQVFFSLPSVVNLSLQGTVAFGFWPTGMPQTSQFTLDKLKSLRLIDSGGLAIRMLLAASAPQLETLWLDCSFDNFPTHLFDAPQLNVNGRPKFPKLKYLTMVMDNFTFSHEFAKIFPTVTHIHFPYPSFREVRMLIQAFSLPRWASLRSLIFSHFKEKDAQQLNTALCRVLPQRRQAKHPLETILVDKDHMRWLKDVVPKEGSLLSKLVRIELLSTDNYGEYWWNVFEREQQKFK